MKLDFLFYVLPYVKFKGMIVKTYGYDRVDYGAVKYVATGNFPAITVRYKNSESDSGIQESTSKFFERKGFKWNEDFWYDTDNDLRICKKNSDEIYALIDKEREDYEALYRMMKWKLGFFRRIFQRIIKFWLTHTAITFRK